VEYGEKNTRYFLNLEKKKRKKEKQNKKERVLSLEEKQDGLKKVKKKTDIF